MSEILANLVKREDCRGEYLQLAAAYQVYVLGRAIECASAGKLQSNVIVV